MSNHQIWIDEAAESDLTFVWQYIDHINIADCDIYLVREGSRDVAVRSIIHSQNLYSFLEVWSS